MTNELFERICAVAPGYRGGTSGALDLPIVFRHVEVGPAALLAGAVDLLAIIGYSVWSFRGRSRRHGWRSAAFIVGVVSVWVAAGSGLAAVDDTNETAHVVQHLLLMMVAPVLLSVGRPVTVVCQAAPRRIQVRIVKAMRSRAVGVITSPWVTWPLYIGAMFVYWLVQPVYAASLRHPVLHDALHAGFLIAGILYWEPLVGDRVGRMRCSHPVRMLAVLLAMPAELLLGVSLTVLHGPLDPGSSVAANAVAGQVFWIVSMLFSGVVVAAIAADWLARAERAERSGLGGRPASSGPDSWAPVPWVSPATAGNSPAPP